MTSLVLVMLIRKKTKGENKMKNYLLTCSKNGVDVNFETTIKTSKKPDFWSCYDIAIDNGCEFFSIDEVK